MAGKRYFRWIAIDKSVRHKGQKSYSPCPLYREGKGPLMFGTGTGYAPWEYLSTLGNKAAERIGVLVVDFQLFLHAELANLLPEKGLALSASAAFTVTAVHLRFRTPVTNRALAVFCVSFVRHILPRTLYVLEWYIIGEIIIR